MASDKVVPSFDEIIQESRKRKKNEQLANEILGKNRRASAPGAVAGPLNKRKAMTGPGASLASRMGVTKRSASAAPKPNINSKWDHDLHSASNNRPAKAPPQGPRNTTVRKNRLYAELQNHQAGNTNSQINIRSAATNGAGGISIKGRAGPYTVVASNFAPGTTAADIEAVMLPIGGEMLNCRLVSSHPTVIAEMMFVNKDGAENVISMFNNKKADGRLLYVYMKDAQPHRPIKAHAQSRPSAPPPQSERDVMDVDEEDQSADRYDSQSQRRAGPDLQDGRYGFSETPGQEYRRDDSASRGRGGRNGRGLVSDRMIRGGRDRGQQYYA